MRALVASVAFLVLAGFAGAADEKIDAKKLIGKWEPVKAEAEGFKSVLEIGEKGKLALHVTVNGKTEKAEGTYKLDGNKIEVELTIAGKVMKDTLTIVKLTDTELVTKGMSGKEDAMKRVTAK